MSTVKKVKTESGNDALEEFQTVKDYLLSCPHVSNEHPALQAALEGLEKEKKRVERDMKLKRKFQKDQNAPVTVERPKSQPAVSVPVGGVEKPVSRGSSPSSEKYDDWHDLWEAKQASFSTSYIGKKLAEESVALISTNAAQATSPLAAVALAFHAAMQGSTLGFSCTGVHDDKPQTGFAAPVREISTFLPEKWQSSSTAIQLRYRKKQNAGAGTAAVVLKVCTADHGARDTDIMVEVTVTPLSAREPKNTMAIALNDYFNLESWKRATSQQTTPLVSPILHYKRLEELMSQFAKAFDLGVDESDKSDKTPAYFDSSVANRLDDPRTASLSSRNSSSNRCEQPWNQSPQRVPTTIGGAFPGLVGGGNRGQFSGDLTPGGIGGPGLLDPGQGGNLMGPSHPSFQGGGGGNPPRFSGGPGMQPRFDPFGPPPTRPDLDVPGMPRRNDGEPNPDHMRPPNNLGNNMFM